MAYVYSSLAFVIKQIGTVSSLYQELLLVMRNTELPCYWSSL